MVIVIYWRMIVITSVVRGAFVIPVSFKGVISVNILHRSKRWKWFVLYVWAIVFLAICILDKITISWSQEQNREGKSQCEQYLAKGVGSWQHEDIRAGSRPQVILVKGILSKIALVWSHEQNAEGKTQRGQYLANGARSWQHWQFVDVPLILVFWLLVLGCGKIWSLVLSRGRFAALRLGYCTMLILWEYRVLSHIGKNENLTKCVYKGLCISNYC